MSQVTIPPDSWSSLVNFDKPKPIKHLYIEQTSQSIKGRYSISPFSEDIYPPKFDPPKDETKNESSSSANFETHSSAVNVTVWVHGEHGKSSNVEAEEGWSEDHIHRAPKLSGSKPVLIMAKTTMGNLKIEVPMYTPPQPLHIRAKSHAGSVLVHIPPTFSGLLSWQCESGGFKPSADVLARYTPVGEQKKHRGVGKIRVADWINDKSERGDSAQLITARGSLYLYEAGEASSATRCTIS